jgi:hypothetical protein
MSMEHKFIAGRFDSVYVQEWVSRASISGASFSMVGV